jgi:cytochrome b6-f complex iron-sulfur subunit
LNGQFYCTEHGAKFDTTGKGLNSEASKGLTVYKTELTANSLRVYS